MSPEPKCRNCGLSRETNAGTYCAHYQAVVHFNGCNHHKPKPITNADHIRSMADEELANLLSPLGSCPVVADGIPFNDNAVCLDDCDACWLNWLKTPAEEGE